MPWKGSIMSQRSAFITQATVEGVNFSRLCEQFGISRDTGYRLVRGFQERGAAALKDRPRRPLSCPHHTPPDVEQRVLQLRDQHPAWGGRKLRARLLALDHANVPAASTITSILRRHGRIDPLEAAKHKPWKRFEAIAPNKLWQMDFKGYFHVGAQRCHPLTIIDDHSRYALGLFACPDQVTATVQRHLISVFRKQGLPEAFLMDNGSCWGGQQRAPYTVLTVWLLRLGIHVLHGRPYHPQTQGKDERFNRTLKLEVLNRLTPHSFSHVQHAFDCWSPIYNTCRPHEALGLAVPASRYRPSTTRFPETLPPLEYPSGMLVRKVGATGILWFNKIRFFIGTAFHGCAIAFKPTGLDGQWDLLLGRFVIGRVEPAYFSRKSVDPVHPLHYLSRAGETDAGSAGEQPAEG